MTTRVTRRSAATGLATQQPEVDVAAAVQLSSPPPTPKMNASRKRKQSKSDDSPSGHPGGMHITSQSSRKRRRPTRVKAEPKNDHLPHGLSDIKPDSNKNYANKMKRTRSTITPKKEAVAETDTQSAPPKEPKNNKYGLTPGQTPYPNFKHPTVHECKEVARLLSTVHGQVKAPKTIPTPSLKISGCGEVPSVLDALIRTRLSAATSNTNSSRAFAGLVAKFGLLEEGIGKGSVDWNKVRLADTKDIFEAIKSGGLADVKSKDIKKILQMVWEENQVQRDSLGLSPAVDNVSEGVLSLDHLHKLSNEEAFSALTKYPGVGPKTASCVLLFCLQRPDFAVDTHVFRLSKWLGWVPPPGDPAGLAPGAKGTFAGPTRNSTYAHLNVKIPDDLKYPLHYLFIKHGRTCSRCRAITGENSEGWADGCVIDHLVQRTGGRKDVRPSPSKPTAAAPNKRVKRKSALWEDESDELKEMSNLGSTDDESDFTPS